MRRVGSDPARLLFGGVHAQHVREVDHGQIWCRATDGAR